MKNYLMAFLVIVFLTGCSSALSLKQTLSDSMSARVASFSCAVNFTNAQIDLIGLYMPGAGDLNPAKEALNGDIRNLTQYAQASDLAGFNTYAETTFKNDMGDAVNAIRIVKKNAKDYNLTKSERKEVRDQLDMDRQTYKECHNNAEIMLALKISEFYEAWIEQWHVVIAQMNRREYNTTVLSSVIYNAETLMTKPLENAINSGDASQARAAEAEVRNIHLHMWVQFTIQRLYLYTERLEQKDFFNTHESELDEVRALLAESSDKAASGKSYSDEEFQQTWGNLQDAAQKLRTIALNMRDG